MKITNFILAGLCLFSATGLLSAEGLPYVNQTMTDLFTCCEEGNQRFYPGYLRIPVSETLSDFESIQEAKIRSQHSKGSG